MWKIRCLVPARQHRILERMMREMLGHVSISVSHVSNSVSASSQIARAVVLWHVHTCGAVSFGFLQRGQVSTVSIFHRNVLRLIAHHPVACFVIHLRRAASSSAIAVPVHDHATSDVLRLLRWTPFPWVDCRLICSVLAPVRSVLVHERPLTFPPSPHHSLSVTIISSSLYRLQ